MIRFNLIEQLKIIFNIKKPLNNNFDKRKAGVINEGSGTIFDNCVGVGPDAGIINKGKDMKSINSKWIATGKN